MVCASLRHRGTELLGVRKGLEAYAASGSTMGVPLLYPWANRIAERRFEVLGRTVDLDRAPHRFRNDAETGLPMPGAIAAGGARAGAGAGGGRGGGGARGGRSGRGSLEWGADEELMAAFPFAHRVTMQVSLE